MKEVERTVATEPRDADGQPNKKPHAQNERTAKPPLNFEFALSFPRFLVLCSGCSLEPTTMTHTPFDSSR
jgi:hypothetical protein